MAKTIPIYPEKTTILSSNPNSEWDDDGLDYMPMPKDMESYHAPILPEPEEVAGMSATQHVMQTLYAALQQYQQDKKDFYLSLNELDTENLRLVGQILGDGEVKIHCEGQQSVKIQESVMAGIWQIQYLNQDQEITDISIAVCPVPECIHTVTEADNQASFDLADMPDNLMNAPSILNEIQAKQKSITRGQAAHVINISLLPITEEDQQYLKQKLGYGHTRILSRGYGNCRITSTKIKNVWWVQYFNSMDQLILNTIEIVDIPQVAHAAEEDIADTTHRLKNLLQDYLDWVV